MAGEFAVYLRTGDVYNVDEPVAGWTAPDGALPIVARSPGHGV